MISRLSIHAALLAAATALPAAVSAVTIDFEDAGFGSLVDRKPPYLADEGIRFGGSAFSLVDEDSPAGFPGSGNFARAPTPIGVMTFFDDEASVGPAIVNYAAGFNVEVEFAFSTINTSAFVEVYSGLDGSGELLGRIELEPLGSALGQPFPPPDGYTYDDYGDYNNWEETTLEFEGVGRSIVFGGAFLPPVGGFVTGDVLYDDITFSYTPPVPEPATFALMLAGLGGLAFASRRRRL